MHSERTPTHIEAQPAALTYEPTPPNSVRLHWKWKLNLYLLAALVLGAGVLPAIELRQDNSWVDPVTGSRRTQTVWLFRISSAARVTPSPLETRLKKMGFQWQQTWQFTHGPSRNVFGRIIKHSCGSAPPIYSLDSGVQGLFVASSSDAEITRFVQLMQTGTVDQQRDAVIQAIKVGFAYHAKQQ